MTPHIILVGLPGVGKTTVGRHVAKELGLAFSDFDDEISEKFGKSVAKIFAEDGEAAFRKAEAELSLGWVSRGPAVLAPGGGWIANREAVAHLRPSCRIIYLRVSPTEALRRMGRGINRRPLFASGDPVDIMQRLYETRRAYYEADADAVVETEGLTRDVLVGRVAGAVSAILDLKHESHERRI